MKQFKRLLFACLWLYLNGIVIQSNMDNDMGLLYQSSIRISSYLLCVDPHYLLIKHWPVKLIFCIIFSIRVQQSIFIEVYSISFKLMAQNTIKQSQNNSQMYLSPSNAPSAILRQSIKRISLKFTSSQKSPQLKSMNLAMQNKKCKLLDLVKDQDYNKEGQVLLKYSGLKQTQGELSELIEYYKFYTQTSIIYQPIFFRLMHIHRESKKEVEYNRLKILLHLSCSEPNSQENLQKSSQSNFCSASSLFILSKLNVSQSADQQSEVIMKLNNKLEKDFGPNCFRTVEQLDKNYNFQKKKIDNPLDVNLFKKITHLGQKENVGNKNNKIHHKRNSCEQISIKKPIIKQSSLHKKKQLSMDNISNLVKDCFPKERKPKIIENTIKKSSKIKQKHSQQLALQYSSKFEDIKATILDAKEKIQKEKLQLKKKMAPLCNQSDIQKKPKKFTPLPAPQTEKLSNKKLTKFTFF